MLWRADSLNRAPKQGIDAQPAASCLENKHFRVPFTLCIKLDIFVQRTTTAVTRYSGVYVVLSMERVWWDINMRVNLLEIGKIHNKYSV